MDRCTMNDGCKLSYRYYQHDDKPCVVLSNSLGTNMEMWSPQLSALQQSFSVLLYDMRGHGASSVFPGSYSIDRLACDVIELLDKLQIGCMHFCGLSIGAMVGQCIAGRNPERLLSLTLSNTSTYLGPPSFWKDRIDRVYREGMVAIWGNMVQRWFTEGFIESNPETIDEMKSMFLSINAEGYAGCCAAIRDMDMRNQVISKKIPTLIITGSLDRATPPVLSHYLLKQYVAAEQYELEAAHLSNIEQADMFTTRLLEFLRNQSK